MRADEPLVTSIRRFEVGRYSVLKITEFDQIPKYLRSELWGISVCSFYFLFVFLFFAMVVYHRFKRREYRKVLN